MRGAVPVADRGRPLRRTAAARTGAVVRALGTAAQSEWSVAFVGVLGYVYASVTYRFPIAAPSIIVALLGLALERVRAVFPGFLVLFALYVGWTAVGLTVSYQRAFTLDEVVVLLKLFAVAFAIVNVVRSAWRVRMFAIVFLGCFALYPVRGTLVNYFVAGYSLFGRALWNFIYSNSNDLAALCFFPLALSLALLYTERPGWIRRAAFLGTGVLSLIVLLTQSRGALIALVISTLVFFLTQSGRRRVRQMLIAALVVVAVVPFVPQSAWHRFSGLTKLTSTETIGEADPEGSADARFNIWRVARTIISENPATGVGLGAYPIAHAQYTARVPVPPAAQGFKDTHSTYLNVAAETGLPGLMLFLSMIALVVVDAERTRRRVRGSPRSQQLLALELGLLAFMVAGVFGSFAKLGFLYVQLAFMWGLADVAKREGAAGQGGNAVRPTGTGFRPGGRVRSA